jgi:hypothetical protein
MNVETTDKAATVAEQDAHAPEKAGSKKGASHVAALSATVVSASHLTS